MIFHHVSNGLVVHLNNPIAPWGLSSCGVYSYIKMVCHFQKFTVGKLMAIVCDEFLGSATDSYPYTKYMFDDGFPVITWDECSSR